MCCMCATQEGGKCEKSKTKFRSFDKIVFLLLPFLSVPWFLFHLPIPLQRNLLLSLSYI